MNSDDQSKIDELNDALYSRNAPEVRTKRRLRFQKPEATEVQEDWQHAPEISQEEVELNKIYKENNSMSFFTKILVGSIIFFILAVGIGALLLFKGSNIVSAKNVDIQVSSPVSISGGETVPFDIQVLNQNNIKLEMVNLTINFPDGTTEVDNSLQELKTFKETMSDIQPGGMGQKNIQALMYGEENTTKTVTITVEYHVKGSNATFQKEKTVDILISSSPLSLKISSFKEVNTGQEFEMTVTLDSNSDEVIKNLLIKGAYPFGFTFISSDLKPISENNTWLIGDIPPGGKKTLKIKGRLEGQDEEARVFRFTTGAFSLNNNKVIGTEYSSVAQEVNIKKPFMTVGVSMDGDEDVVQYVGEYDDSVKIDVSYFNNLNVSINDAEIHVKLSGSAYDKNYVSPDDGLFKSEDNEIVWNGITTSDLRTIGAGDSGHVSFNITPKNLSVGSKIITNPELKIEISVRGRRSSEDNVPENLTATAARTIKIASEVDLSGQVVRVPGPFKNTGPVPPKAEQESTYTVIWTVNNTSSSVSNAEVHASLPPYVKWLGKIEPSNENIKYDASLGKLVWSVGNLGTNTINSAKRRQVAFQISIKPSVTQIGQVPILVNAANLVAQDDFTGETLRSNLGELTTRFSTDSSFIDGDEKVTQ